MKIYEACQTKLNIWRRWHIADNNSGVFLSLEVFNENRMNEWVIVAYKDALEIILYGCNAIRVGNCLFAICDCLASYSICARQCIFHNVNSDCTLQIVPLPHQKFIWVGNCNRWLTISILSTIIISVALTELKWSALKEKELGQEYY